MALKLYNPVTGAFDTVSAGVSVSDTALMLNILIELRVANVLAQQAIGMNVGELDQLRQDIAQEL